MLQFFYRFLYFYIWAHGRLQYLLLMAPSILEGSNSASEPFLLMTFMWVSSSFRGIRTRGGLALFPKKSAKKARTVEIAPAARRTGDGRVRMFTICPPGGLIPAPGWTACSLYYNPCFFVKGQNAIRSKKKKHVTLYLVVCENIVQRTQSGVKARLQGL